MALRQTVRDRLAADGVELLEEPRRFEALLRDLHPTERARVSALAESVHCGIARRFAAAPASLDDPDAVRDAVLTLCVGGGLSPQIARWVMETWRVALGGEAEPAPVAPPVSAISDRPGALGDYLG